jgi:hypothetical protein
MTADYRFCPKCATPRAGDLPFCGGCGFAFSVPERVAPKVDEELPSAPSPADQSPELVQPAQPLMAAPAARSLGKNEKLAWWIALAVITLIAIGAAGRSTPSGFRVDATSLFVSLGLYLSGFGIAFVVAILARDRGKGPTAPFAIVIWGVVVGWVVSLALALGVSGAVALTTPTSTPLPSTAVDNVATITGDGPRSFRVANLNSGSYRLTLDSRAGCYANLSQSGGTLVYVPGIPSTASATAWVQADQVFSVTISSSCPWTVVIAYATP